MIIKIDSLENIADAAKKFLAEAGDRRVFAFHGGMGAGKTTFIKALCSELGVTEVVASPTFAIVNEYMAQNGEPVYHFDLYRVKTMDEACDFGCEDYFYSGSYCFIEWPELVEPLLPDDTADVCITVDDEGHRAVELK
ncbi:MAG: tRNA (adenosine(37)-N6)-threonylcarbamoyltransferase complex ATPase subunit type 1 TsaE [Paludibacteraceae bacterium]|jgi:tRNA threonylcarbamoyladenosine biosynthesis protein TsaE|nr:tRNA (adenosine(37)-N6)-threonylcarbamoyltransferase complex ATPase subunit type 1 TsaE [Paludibacteraceae bacterium]MBQ3896003.1 tRNA (adenosine(37)-N6)-threonylcarbamoyltransferase complex ATPase subunit type 1 TsaE [Paludibacteraceae bacterium]MBQ6962797.1 tRNA (adenosine(37)-N6)-threonylcarbamoyltransferase complex ATPase subunit type 1 TsaE [Paludibacteraceae bacterium]MBQ7747465.1 tRNA (adenosine(37)-N6)-threonylcarbamoyltransferase complex ATPase subunit type 1 TsaE [Paludibacteraceae 